MQAAINMFGTDAVAALTKRAYDTKPAVRRDVARATATIDTTGDALRLILLRDSDLSVGITLLAAVSRRPAADVSPALVKEITARAANEPDMKIAALYALPRVLNDKNAQAVSAFASGEMFDTDERVKIAAIRALGYIARNASDPVIAENAKSSLSLTMQDRSPSIVHHTMRALGKEAP